MSRSSSEAEWLKVRQEWLSENPPNFQGYYTCYLCRQWVHISEVSLDHVIPRSKRPDLRLEKTNLKPTHGICNYNKGSRSVDKVLVAPRTVDIDSVW